ncbi:MAG TPA: hypothetical protein PK048_00500 [Candidatus Absconditabacterales bacterium]|nr:hypothetical protein [Candidatus Absconditabacterales bacterium]
MSTKKTIKSSNGSIKKGLNQGSYTIADIQRLPINDVVHVLEKFQHSSNHPDILLHRIIDPLLERCRTIQSLGLGYLTLSRSMETLSGGEIQRMRLAKQLGNKLTGIIYVLDEPTIGLDTQEIQKVIRAIQTLKEMGNTIVVVEHNEEFITASDRITEIGPGSGDFGGKVIFNGSYDEFLASDCLTAQYIRGEKKVHVDFNHTPKGSKLTIKQASKYNLDIPKVEFPLGSFTIVTGPSGAGKTTLLHHTLYRFLDERQTYIQSFVRMNMLRKGVQWSDIVGGQLIKQSEFAKVEEQAMDAFYKELEVDSIAGWENVQNVIYVDQSSIGKTPRSCPATFIGIFDTIRRIFASSQDAKMLGLKEGHFSFNSDKGACTECDGYGQKKIELQFLPDTYVPCSLCKGHRYKSEVLGIKRNGKSVADILEMYIHEAYDFFKDIGFIQDELKLMCDIGLGYLKMGQPAQTLSGGESQRLKLVRHLLKQYRGHSVYFLDEPTVGLHPEDIQKLLLVLKQFLDRGDTILMIEHDHSLLQFADCVISLDQGSVSNIFLNSP